MSKDNRSKSAIATILCTLLLATFSYTQQTPPYQALITDIQGNVMIKKRQEVKFKKALWGSQLSSGDQLKTLDASQVSLLFLNNNLVTLGANSSLTIAQNTLSSGIAASTVTNLGKELPSDLPLLSFRETAKGEIGVLAGLRSGSKKEITLLSPRNSKLKTLQPTFKWQAKDDFDQFKVSLFDDNGKVWSKKIKGSSLTFPQDETKLNYGNPYFWYVEGEGLFENHRSESVGFNIADEEAYQAINTKAENILKMFKNNPESNSYSFVLGSYYEKEGFFKDAIVNFEIIARKNEDAPLPHQILGKLYQKIGLTDKAISELQKASKLNRNNM